MLLQRMGDDDALAHHELLERVYDELRGIAGSKLKHDPAQRSISATALVHEAWLRITPADGSPAKSSNRRHFFAAAAEAMRRILVKQARRRMAHKRTAPAVDDFHAETVHSSGNRSRPSALNGYA